MPIVYFLLPRPESVVVVAAPPVGVVAAGVVPEVLGVAAAVALTGVAVGLVVVSAVGPQAASSKLTITRPNSGSPVPGPRRVCRPARVLVCVCFITYFPPCDESGCAGALRASRVTSGPTPLRCPGGRKTYRPASEQSARPAPRRSGRAGSGPRASSRCACRRPGPGSCCG